MINSVRNTVLSVLNKNNYGYISPSDFNLYCQQAQMELYDEYFSSYNKAINAENMRSSGTEYADLAKTIAEVLEGFLTSNFLVPSSNGQIPTNEFYIPSLITTGDTAYMLNKIICYTKYLTDGYNDSNSPFMLIDSNADFVLSGVSVGDIIVNATSFQASYITEVFSPTDLYIYEDIFPVDFDDYIIFSGTSFSEAEKVTNGKITMLNSSLLTAPSLIYPAYTLIKDLMKVYPTSINLYGAVKADYFRYPLVPKWTYSTLANGEPVFNQSQPDYQDFELPNEDEYKLAVKILQYCGISIRETEVTQFALAQEQHEQPSFSMKQ